MAGAAPRAAGRPPARSSASRDIRRPPGTGWPLAMAQSSTAKLRLARVCRRTPRITGASPYFMIRYAKLIPDRDKTPHPASREPLAPTLTNDLETAVQNGPPLQVITHRGGPFCVLRD
jgi:hypothetical protein